MSASPRFLVAKYIPEARRMEPRNIGVVLWSDGSIATRFLGDDPNRQGTKSYPRFVTRLNYPVYRDWVTYWRKLAASPALPDARNKGRIPRQSPDFLDALKLKSKENFVLLDGGVFPVPIKAPEMQGIAEELFAELVDDGHTESQEATESQLLTTATKAFIRLSGIRQHPGYNREYPVRYKWRDVSRDVRFHFGLGGTDGNPSPRPEALFQPTRLTDMKDVNNSLFLFEGITDGAQILPKNRCLSLVYAPWLSPAPEVGQAIASLQKVSTVIDVSTPDTALAQVREGLAQLLGLNGNGHHLE